MKKRVLGIAAAMMVSIGLAGCSTSNQQSATASTDAETVAVEEAVKIPDPQKKDLPLHIAYVNAEMNTYYSLVLDGMNEELERYGGDEVGTIDVYSPTNASKMVEEQIGFLETLLQDDSLDVLCFSTHNDTEFIPYLKQFAERGVSVYLFNMPAQDVTNDYYVSLVSYDFEDAGRKMGEWAKNNLEGDIKMLYLEGQEGSHNTIRTAGFMEGIEGADNIEIVVSQPANWTRQGGQEVTENALQSNPEINCVYGPYDEMPLGAIVALRDAGKLQDTVVLGYDCTEDGYNSIVAGEMAASVNTDAKQMGTNLIDTIVAHDLEGKEVEHHVMNTLTVIDQSNTDTIPADNYFYTEQPKSKEIDR
ncbi:MAG: sugar ABC transporter substrate-binding protein [Clostridiales bacterium]|nr:sugar ABC transporter substrate-binding protein [Clostridiales bacterium]